MAAHGQVAQAVEHLGKAHAGRRPHARKGRFGGEPGHRVDLVDQKRLILGEEHVHPGQAVDTKGGGHLGSKVPNPVTQGGVEIGRHLRHGRPGPVLVGMVEELAMGPGLRYRRHVVAVGTIAQDRHAQLTACDARLDDQRVVVAGRLRYRCVPAGGVDHPADADRRAQVGRLDVQHGRAQPVDRVVVGQRRVTRVARPATGFGQCPGHPTRRGSASCRDTLRSRPTRHPRRPRRPAGRGPRSPRPRLGDRAAPP